MELGRGDGLKVSAVASDLRDPSLIPSLAIKRREGTRRQSSSQAFVRVSKILYSPNCEK